MITINELFKKYDVECPLWLSDVLDDDEWLEKSEYSFDGELHRWIIETEMFFKVIDFTEWFYELRVYSIDDVNLEVPLTSKSISADGLCMNTC